MGKKNIEVVSKFVIFVYLFITIHIWVLYDLNSFCFANVSRFFVLLIWLVKLPSNCFNTYLLF